MSGAFLAVSFGPGIATDPAVAEGIEALTTPVGGSHRTTWGTVSPGGVMVRTWQRASRLGSTLELGDHQARMRLGLAGITSSVETDGTTVWAGCDDLGYGTLFVWQGPDGTAAVATRPELLTGLARLLGHPPRADASVAAELTHLGWLSPHRTGWHQIAAVRAANRVELRQGRAQVIHDPEVGAWATEPPRRRPLPEIVDEAADLLRDNVAAVLHTDTPVKVDVTAGRDSRMVLAALVSLDALDRVELQTVGGPALADVVAGRALADSVGARHRHGYFYPASDLAFADRFRRHVALTTGAANAKDGMREPLPHVDEIRVSGLMGENLRGWPTPIPRDAPVADDLRPFVNSYQAGRLDILLPDARAEAQECLRAELLDTGHADLPVWFARHRYFAEVRLRSRMSRVDDVTPEMRAYPLYSHELTAVATEILWHHPDVDVADALIAHLAPQLDQVEIPPPPAPAAGSPSGPPTDKAPSLMQAALGGQAGSRREFFASLVDTESAAWDRIDRAAYRAAVAGYDELTNPQLRLLHGAAGAIVWLAG